MKFNFTQENIKDLEAKGFVPSYDHYMHIIGKYFPNDTRKTVKDIMKNVETAPDVIIAKMYNLAWDIVYLNNCYCRTLEGAKVDQEIVKCAKQLVKDCKTFKKNDRLRDMIRASYRYMVLMVKINELYMAEEWD